MQQPQHAGQRNRDVERVDRPDAKCHRVQAEHDGDGGHRKLRTPQPSAVSRQQHGRCQDYDQHGAERIGHQLYGPEPCKGIGERPVKYGDEPCRHANDGRDRHRPAGRGAEVAPGQEVANHFAESVSTTSSATA